MEKKASPVFLQFAKKAAKRWCLFLLSGLIVSGAKAQTPALDTLQVGLENYLKEAVQEKVFLHTDKTFFLTGETLWFKAYVVNAATHEPIDLSKVLYVELLDDQLKPALLAMVALNQGTGDGSFVLPASMRSGNYLLRAYTAWMRNFDETFFFHLPLQVVNTTRQPDWASFEKKKAYSLRFFPEGGNLVDGIQTRLGFQLVDQNGRGVDGKGYLIGNGKDTVARFRPLKFGIGRLSMTPKTNVTYKAVVHLANGDTVVGSLPAVEKTGYVLQVSDIGDGQLQVSAAADETQKGQTIYLLAHTKGGLKFSSSQNLATSTAGWLLSKDSIGEGITTFTLFDAKGQPVCERLYYKRPLQRLKLGLKTEAPVYATRTKVNVELSATGQRGEPATANLSLSVFRLDSLQGLPDNFIEPSFWLASEFKGKVESPLYYFSTATKETDEAMDNLMLTHGWRRFTWAAVQAKQKPALRYLPEYEGHLVKGRIVSKISGDPVPHRLCFLTVPAERFQVSNAISNEKGELTFVLKNSYGPMELVAQAAGADNTVQIELSRPFAPAPSSYPLPAFSLWQKWKSELYNRHVNVQVSNVFRSASANSLWLPNWRDTGVFYGQPDGSYQLDEFTRFPTMEEVIREVVVGAQLRRERDSFRLNLINLPYRQYFNEGPLLLLDGVPVFSANKLMAFDPLKLKKIDVVLRKYYWGHTTNNGIVSFRTYEGDLANFDPDPGVVLIDYHGLQLKREFYAPVYDEAASIKSREPDRRNVLHWQPSVITNQSGTKFISFYTSDLPGRYAILVHGIDDIGGCGSKWITFEVN